MPPLKMFVLIEAKLDQPFSFYPKLFSQESCHDIGQKNASKINAKLRANIQIRFLGNSPID